MSIDVQSLKEKFDLRDYITAVLGEPERRGYREWVWQSPFVDYNQRTGSLYANQDVFLCRAQNIGGSIIDFVKLTQNVDFLGACEILGSEKIERFQRKPAGQKHDTRKGRMISIHDVNHFSSQIDMVMPYLQQRTIDPIAIDINKIGGLKTTWSYTFADGETVYPTFRRVAIPSIVGDRVLGFIQRRDENSVAEWLETRPDVIPKMIEESKARGKDISEEGAKSQLFGNKYMKLRGVPDNTIFGANHLVYEEDGKRFWRRLPYVIVAESHFDALTGQSYLFPTLQMKPNSEWDIERIFQGVSMVYIIQQNDDPGIKMSRKIYEALNKSKRKGILVRIPNQYNDINDMAIKGELESFLTGYPNHLTPSMF